MITRNGTTVTCRFKHISSKRIRITGAYDDRSWYNDLVGRTFRIAHINQDGMACIKPVGHGDADEVYFYVMDGDYEFV